jgi:hypothetical protein
MLKAISKATKLVGTATAAVGAARGVYELAVSVEGKPLRARDEPATIRIFGVPVFERDGNLDRTWFGLIPRGKSRYAKRAIAAREGGTQ